MAIAWRLSGRFASFSVGDCVPLVSAVASQPSFNGSLRLPSFIRGLRPLVSTQPAAASSIVLTRCPILISKPFTFVPASDIPSVSRACNARFTSVQRALHERATRAPRACNARSTSVQRAFHARETLDISSSGTEMTVSGARKAVSGTENDPSGTTIFRQYVLIPNS